jgi:SAM-dependent methyltransferase
MIRGSLSPARLLLRLLLLAGVLAATVAWAPGRGGGVRGMAADRSTIPQTDPTKTPSLVIATTSRNDVGDINDNTGPLRNSSDTAHPRTPTFVSTRTPTTAATRSQFLHQVVLGTALACGSSRPFLEPAAALYTEKGIQYPDEGEISAALPTVWSDDDTLVDDASSGDALFRRLDNRKDALFYEQARFVEHVDAAAVTRLTDYCTRVTRSATAVLDLCASGTSHLPQIQRPPQIQQIHRVAGLGMNAEELAANPSLTEWVVQDLNAPGPVVLPYEDASMDVVLCQLSMDYLTQPVAVCRDIARVLRTGGGSVHILFSNRLFLSKAVAVWTGADDIDHAYLVGQYLHTAGDFTNIAAADLSQRRRDGKIVGDPLYVVTAVRC